MDASPEFPIHFLNIYSTIGYYDLGATSLLIRGYDPLADAVEYGRELIPRVRSLVAERDTAHQNNAALPV